MSIQSWPKHDRPRERLIKQGAQALSDAELLAIFLRTGLPGKSAVDLAREMIAQFGGLQNLNRVSLTDWVQVRGLGEAKYAQLRACLEMAKRCLSHELARYFADEQAPSQCGHCSVCRGEVAVLPPLPSLTLPNESGLRAWCDPLIALCHSRHRQRSDQGRSDEGTLDGFHFEHACLLLWEFAGNRPDIGWGKWDAQTMTWFSSACRPSRELMTSPCATMAPLAMAR